MLKPTTARKLKTVARLAFFAVCWLVVAFFLKHFPWRRIPAVLASANPGILWAALAVNLVSLVAKGSAWYFLLRPAARCRWGAVQEANLLGAAMNTVSVTVVGETARVQDLAAHEGVSAGEVAASVVRTRAVEALALACFMLLAPALLSLPPLLHGLQIAGGALMLALVAAAWSGKHVRLLGLVPARVRTILARLTETGSPSVFVPAVFFALLNWVTQWATYHLVISALGIPVTLSASFTALIVTNLAGLFRLSPGNVGVTQAAMIVSLVPFGTAADEALAAGFALQAIQILPVLLAALLALGGRELVRHRSSIRRGGRLDRSGREGALE